VYGVNYIIQGDMSQYYSYFAEKTKEKYKNLGMVNKLAYVGYVVLMLICGVVIYQVLIREFSSTSGGCSTDDWVGMISLAVIGSVAYVFMKRRKEGDVKARKEAYKQLKQDALFSQRLLNDLIEEIQESLKRWRTLLQWTAGVMMTLIVLGVTICKDVFLKIFDLYTATMPEKEIQEVREAFEEGGMIGGEVRSLFGNIFLVMLIAICVILLVYAILSLLVVRKRQILLIALDFRYYSQLEEIKVDNSTKNAQKESEEQEEENNYKLEMCPLAIVANCKANTITQEEQFNLVEGKKLYTKVGGGELKEAMLGLSLFFRNTTNAYISLMYSSAQSEVRNWDNSAANQPNSKLNLSSGKEGEIVFYSSEEDLLKQRHKRIKFEMILENRFGERYKETFVVIITNLDKKGTDWYCSMMVQEYSVEKFSEEGTDNIVGKASEQSPKKEDTCEAKPTRDVENAEELVGDKKCRIKEVFGTIAVMVALLIFFLVCVWFSYKYAFGFLEIVLYVLLDGIFTYVWENKVEEKKTGLKLSANGREFKEEYYDIYHNVNYRRIKLMWAISFALILITNMGIEATGGSGEAKSFYDMLKDYSCFVFAGAGGVMLSAIVISQGSKYNIVNNICFKRKKDWWSKYDSEDEENLRKLALTKKELRTIQDTKQIDCQWDSRIELKERR